MRTVKKSVSSAKHRQVIYDPVMFRNIVHRLHRAYPNEFGGFLFSQTHFDRSETFIIQGCSFGKVGSVKAWDFYSDDVRRAQRLAARKNLRLVGYFHSHPWNDPPYSMITQSSSDADIQDDFDLSLSLIVGICPDYWISATWRRGYTAPYPQLVGNEVVDIWCKNNSQDKILANHYYLKR